MFDIKRIRERAADWLGRVGDRLFIATDHGMTALERRVRGHGPDESWERADDSDGELRARIKATPDGVSPPAGDAAWNKCPACGQLVDCVDVSDGSEVRCLGCRAWLAVTLWEDWTWSLEPLICVYAPDDDESAAGTSPPAGQDPAPHPPGGVQPVDSASRWKFGPIAGPVDVVKPPHNAATGALGEAAEVGICSRPRCPEGEKLRAIGRYCPCGAELRPVGVVTPPDPFVIITPEAVGTLGGAALAADIEEQRLSHGGCTRLPREMLAALGVKDGDLVWFLRSTPGGRWEAWTSAELDEQLGMGQDLGPEHIAARKAAVDAMPHHVPSRLTAGEARRLGAKGWTVGVVWFHDDDGARHEFDGDDLAHLQSQASLVDDPVPADAPPLECQIHPTELDASCALCAFPVERATPPVAGAAERVPEGPSGGAGASSWRGLEHEVAPCRIYPGEWIVEAIDHASEGEIYGSRFNGPDAEERAREYAAWASEARPVDPRPIHRARAKLNVLAAIVDPRETPDGALNKPRHEIARRLILEAEQALDAALGIPVEPEDVEAQIALDESATPPALPKPSRVEAGQRWRCVGVDGELVVRWLFGDGVSVRLGPAEDEADGKIVARTADMLGLREWSYVGGAR